MTDISANLRLPYIADGQALKHITHNQALQALDAVVQIGIVSRGIGTPPETPDEGDRYIVGASPSGAWAGQQASIAAFQNGAWELYLPQEGWLAWIRDESELVVWSGTDWIRAGGEPINPAAMVGVNTTADATNRLAVKSDAILFSHDDETPGSGDMQVKLNKADTSGTGCVLFQTDWSGRAEMGLAGDDNFSFKVSPDGSVWHKALVVDRNTGVVSFPSGGTRELLTADRTYYVDGASGSNSNDGLSSGPGAFATIQKAFDLIGGLDLSIYSVTINLADGTYTDAVDISVPWVGGTGVSVIGNTSTPSSVTLNVSGTAIRHRNGRPVTLRGVKVISTSHNFLLEDGSKLTLDDIAFAGGTNAISVNSRSEINLGGGSFEVSANYNSVLSTNLQAGGSIYGSSWTLTGTPAWSVAFLYMTGLSNILASGSVSFSGAATGRRYNLNLNSSAVTGGGGATYFPGDVAGTVSTGGQYV